jgi:adenylate kinase family enzyme
MERVAIIGCSGGGKSTLARALGERLGLPVIHLDVLFWKPGWVESDPVEFRAAVDAAVAADRWVSDGNFTRASPVRFARADTVIWMELPRLLCLWRAIRRSLLALGRNRPDLAPGCPEKFDLTFYAYILNWDRLSRPRVEEALAAFAPTARLIRIKSDQQARSVLAQLSQEPVPEMRKDSPAIVRTSGT